MKEIVFSSEQKTILLGILKSQFGNKYDDALLHQMYHDFSKTDKHFFTPKWSRAAWIAVSHAGRFGIFKEEEKERQNWEWWNWLGKLLNQEKDTPRPRPDFSKEYELFHDLETRIRETWDEHETMQIVFKESKK